MPFNVVELGAGKWVGPGKGGARRRRCGTQLKPMSLSGNARVGGTVRCVMPGLLLLLFALRGTAVGEDLQALRELAAPDNLQVLAAGGLLAAAAHGVDSDVRDGMDGRSPFDCTADLTNVYGSSAVNVPVSVLLWSAGALRHRAGLRATGGDLLRTLLITQALVGPVKVCTGRERPDGSNRRSFPSGHAANSFAVARLMQLRHGRGIGLPLYGVAALTAVGRLADNRHYLSDVIMGAGAGIVAANCAVWTSEAHRRIALVPFPGTHGLAVSWAF